MAYLDRGGIYGLYQEGNSSLMAEEIRKTVVIYLDAQNNSAG